MGLVLLPLALIAYFNGIFLAITATVRRSAPAQRGSALSLALAWMFHLGAIVYEGVRSGYFPLMNLSHYLLVLGWVVLSLYLLVWFRSRMVQVGLILPPLAALMAFAALLFPAASIQLPPGQQKAWFVFHVGISILGMVALCLAFAMSLIYLLQDRALKAKRAPRVMERLPSLAVCDRAGYHAVLWGFPLLTLGIVTGEVLSYAVRQTFWIGGAKQIFPILAWIVLALLLYARVIRGFGGRKSAYVTIAGFVLGILTVFGMTR